MLDRESVGKSADASYRSNVDPIFITGGTGYIGRPLIDELLMREYNVRALVRAGSVKKLSQGAVPIIGDALDASTFVANIPPKATLIHLVGTPHPSPAKAAEFRRIDLASIQAATTAARQARVQHFIYVSVAHPAPVMQAYIDVRREGEALVRDSGISSTILRPWYVLGPGHRWPYLLLPLYALMGRLPATRDSAERLGLVTLKMMIDSLVCAVEAPRPSGVLIMGVREIREASMGPSSK